MTLSFEAHRRPRPRGRLHARLQRLHRRRLPRRTPGGSSRSGYISLADVGEAVREVRRCVEQPRHDRRPRPAEPAGAASRRRPSAFPGVRLPKHLSHPGLPPDPRRRGRARRRARRARLARRVPALGHRRAGRHLHPLPHLRPPEPDADGARHVRLRGRLRPLPAPPHGLPRGGLRLGARTSCTPSTSTGRSASATSIPTCASRMRRVHARAAPRARRSGRQAPPARQGARASTTSCAGAEREPRRRDRDAYIFEHRGLDHDPIDFFRRGQVFVSFESDDPAPAYLREALGEMGEDLACFSADYGHWDGVLTDCVTNVGPAARLGAPTPRRSCSPGTVSASTAPASKRRFARPPAERPLPRRRERGSAEW